MKFTSKHIEENVNVSKTHPLAELAWLAGGLLLLTLLGMRRRPRPPARRKTVTESHDTQADWQPQAARVMTVSENQAYVLKEHLGTQPRVYYIPGHGEAVGRDPYSHGRMATTWPWQRRARGSRTWGR